MFKVTTEIYEKARKAEELEEQLKVLTKELALYFKDPMCDCGIVDYGVSDKPFGDDQGEGEWVDQWGNPDSGYSGSVYFLAENGKFVRIGYECW